MRYHLCPEFFTQPERLIHADSMSSLSHHVFMCIPCTMFSVTRLCETISLGFTPYFIVSRVDILGTILSKHTTALLAKRAIVTNSSCPYLIALISLIAVSVAVCSGLPPHCSYGGVVLSKFATICLEKNLESCVEVNLNQSYDSELVDLLNTLLLFKHNIQALGPYIINRILGTGAYLRPSKQQASL